MMGKISEYSNVIFTCSVVALLLFAKRPASLGADVLLTDPMPCREPIPESFMVHLMRRKSFRSKVQSDRLQPALAFLCYQPKTSLGSSASPS